MGWSVLLLVTGFCFYLVGFDGMLDTERSQMEMAYKWLTHKFGLFFMIIGGVGIVYGIFRWLKLNDSNERESEDSESCENSRKGGM